MKGNCVICGAEIEVTMCCSGRECGCMGLPSEMPVCSIECEKEYVKRRDGTDQSSQKADI